MENNKAILDVLENLIAEHFGVLASDDMLEFLADNLNDTWENATSDDVLKLLQEAGIEEADEETAFEFNEDLYNKLYYGDLEE